MMFLTQWPKKVLSNIRNETSLHRTSGHCRTSLTTNIVLKTSFPFRVKLKKLLGEDCLKMENKIFTVF